MSLWTPSGERPIRKNEPGAGPGPVGAPPGGPPGGPPAGGPGGGAGGGPDGPRSEEEAAAQLEAMRQQLADAPAEVVVANHCYGLFELAAVYLSSAPPRLADAKLAIDAFGALVEGVGDRLGDGEGSLTQALAQVRLAYVQIAEATAAAEGDLAGGTG